MKERMFGFIRSINIYIDSNRLILGTSFEMTRVEIIFCPDLTLSNLIYNFDHNFDPNFDPCHFKACNLSGYFYLDIRIIISSKNSPIKLTRFTEEFADNSKKWNV